MFVKMQVDTDDSVIPRRREDEKFCELFVNGGIVAEDDESDEAVRVIADWLLSHGVPKRIALRAAADEDFRECISRELQIGIERLITAWGAAAWRRSLAAPRRRRRWN